MTDTENQPGAAATAPGDTTILDPRSDLVTMINTYAVDPDRADDLIDFLVEATRSTLRHVPGFVSANLHVALDRTQVMNYAQWNSRAALAAARENADVAALMRQQMTIATGFAPVPYELRVAIPAPR